MGSSDKVSSPSFTLSNEYKSGKLTLYHFDFYRLDEPGIMKDELAEVIADKQAVTVVEWAAIVEDILPEGTLRVTIKAAGENDRTFTYEYPGSLRYLMEDT